MGPSVTVAIVVDPAFGEQLRALPARMPVWVLDTPVNRAAAHRFWPGGAEAGCGRSVTTFIGGDETPEDACIRILPTVDTHHNELAQKPPYPVIQVFGARPTAEFRRALEEHGFLVVQEEGPYFIVQGQSRAEDTPEA